MGPNKDRITRTASPRLAPRAARRDRARRDRTESDVPVGVTFVHTPPTSDIYTDKTTLRVIRRLGGGEGSGEKETMVVLTVVMVVVMVVWLRRLSQSSYLFRTRIYLFIGISIYFS